MSETSDSAPAASPPDGPSPPGPEHRLNHPESARGLTARLGATLLFAGLWLGVALLAWWLAWPGPTPELTLEAPPMGLTLPLDRRVTVNGHSRRAKALHCNGQAARLEDGRFRVDLDPPGRPGMFLIRCAATNKRGRRFPFVWGRLAGPSAPLTAPIEDAVVLALELRDALAPGGVLEPLGRLASQEISSALIQAAMRLVFKPGGIVLGPLSISGASLIGVESAGSHRLKLHMALHDVSLLVGIPESILPEATPEWLKGVAVGLAGQKRIPLGKRLPVNVGMEWAPGQEPRVVVGPLGSDHLARALQRFGPLAQAALKVLGTFLPSLAERMSRGLSATEGLLGRLTAAFEKVKAQLAQMGGLIPALPRAMSPHQVAACLHLELARLQTDRRSQRLRIHLSARVTSYTTGGQRCAEARHHFPFPATRRRLVFGPPTVPQDPSPTLPGGQTTTTITPKAPDPARPTSRPAIQLWVAHDLVNAWLAAVWAGGAFTRVPVSLPEAREAGFDIRSLSYGLPPVVSTDPRGRLRLELPELGVSMLTVGEPQRWLTTHLRIPLRVDVPQPGRLSFLAERKAPPQVWVRCDAQGEGSGACSGQSRRFQQLADIATELAFRPELAGPRLAVHAALPALGAGPLTVEVTSVTPVPRGLKITLRLR